MWKFHDYFATQILREIIFGHFEASKTAILTVCAALNFEFLVIFDIIRCEFFPKIKIKASKTVKMVVFDLLKSVQIAFT